MAYEPTIWKDRAVERPRTFNIVNNPDGTITLVPVPGVIAEEGTPVNAANLNKLEQGLKTHEAESVPHGVATKTQAEEGTSNLSYMTPLRTREAINALASTVPSADKIPIASSGGKIDSLWINLRAYPSDVDKSGLNASYMTTGNSQATERLAGTVIMPISGTVRIKFGLEKYQSTNVFGRVTINDYQIMSESNSTSALVTYESERTVDIGDTIKFYYRSAENGKNSYLRNPEVCYTVETVL